MVKNVSAVWETWVRSLGQEDPLEKEMATHCSVLTWRFLWTEEPDRLHVHGDSPGKNTTVGCHFLLQGIFLTQESNWGLLRCRGILYPAELPLRESILR